MKKFIVFACLMISSIAQAVDLKQVFKDLNSEDAIVRDNARTQLSEAPVVVVREVMNYYRSNSSSYRVQVGILVGLEGMLIKQESEITKIYAMLEPRDIEAIVYAVTHTDSSMAHFAKSVLLLLDDPRTPQYALSLANKYNSSQADYRQIQYNLIVIAQETYLLDLPTVEAKTN